VAPGGYLWWYVDALSDDGRHGVTLIALLGSVFSPYYAWSGRRDPLNHCTLNAVLYGEGGHRWAMTERGRNAVRRDARSLAIGPSALAWEGDALVVRVDEVTAPIPLRLRGTIRVHPLMATGHAEELDGPGRHRWWPISPLARVEVALERPALAWSGTGYLDANAGEESLENGFVDWDWSRAPVGREAAILYDVRRRDGSERSLALRFRGDGTVERLGPRPRVALPRTRWWRVPRQTLSEEGQPAARVLRTLEDTPFYARSVIETQLLGRTLPMMHESLALDRFRANWVRAMLPFRMPRRPS
jgi:carotenoid 1,2-hydratase